jgi:hypothetical protein
MGRRGLEPRTYWLKASCSTIELSTHHCRRQRPRPFLPRMINIPRLIHRGHSNKLKHSIRAHIMCQSKKARTERHIKVITSL